MLTTHVFTEQHQPTARANPHMLSAGVFGGAQPAPKKRVAAPKKVVKKPVRKVHQRRHAQKSLEIHLPHATAEHEAAQHKTALDILNADPERAHVDASGASLTGLASSMLAESDEAEAKQKAAMAKAKAQAAKKHTSMKDQLKKEGLDTGPTLNLDVDDTKDEELPDEKKLPPLDAFLPMGGGDDDDDGF